MRLARFRMDDDRRTFCGVISGDVVEVVTDESYLTGAPEPSGRKVPLADVRLAAPCTPGKVVAVGLNYHAHADEFGQDAPAEPILFIKPSTSVIGPEDDIVYPAMAGQVDYEAELAVVIGGRLSNASPDEARRAVLGYTCLNDVTARDLQQKDGQWTRAKGFDTFCPVGPWIETELDTSDLRIASRLNGRVRQDSTTALMIVPPVDLVSFISRVMTLLPGDVVATGTPQGVGPMVPGDVIEVEVEGIGVLRNRVRG